MGACVTLSCADRPDAAPPAASSYRMWKLRSPWGATTTKNSDETSCGVKPSGHRKTHASRKHARVRARRKQWMASGASRQAIAETNTDIPVLLKTGAAPKSHPRSRCYGRWHTETEGTKSSIGSKKKHKKKHAACRAEGRTNEFVELTAEKYTKKK